LGSGRDLRWSPLGLNLNNHVVSNPRQIGDIIHNIVPIIFVPVSNALESAAAFVKSVGKI
jgi:hypothetical protein